LHKWKSVVKLLAFGISNESLVCKDLFEDLVGQRSGKLDFDECWVPVLHVYIEIGNAKNVQLQSWLLSAEWSSNQWREVFNGVLFPALTYRIGDLAMLETVLKTFLYALNALMESPLFQAIWFRILSGMLEAGRAQKYHEELAEMLANALRVMRENGAFDTRQRMWELTKSNIETSFPEVIRPLVDD
jgi:hypothetical protein